MIFIAVLVCIITATNGQISVPLRDNWLSSNKEERFKPYAFNYNILAKDGKRLISRTEAADGNGRVQGSYTLNNDEGHHREVQYIADQDGFRATILTNEPGTKNENPANVIMAHDPDGRSHFQNSRPVPSAPGIVPEPRSAPVLSPTGSQHPSQRHASWSSASSTSAPPKKQPTVESSHLINGNSPLFTV
ncbi:hypothetical protein CDAR_181491 [Caerostris darwini]|uniref:Uncharacterized protein n=1 Tax=Caerostris darwini TaxID=1538125 RepID=A0AAV4U417_9ARAC|nr:hypothetical protein CDAR_181491 [Caerostris darwini]